MTNGDRVRQMTDEELILLVYSETNTTPWCTPFNENCKHHGEDYECETCMLDWLKEEVKDGSLV